MPAHNELTVMVSANTAERKESKKRGIKRVFMVGWYNELGRIKE